MKRIVKFAAAVATVGAVALVVATPGQAAHRHGRHAGARVMRPHHGYAYAYAPGPGYSGYRNGFTSGSQGGCFRSPSSLGFTMCE
jgi:hypothetical protein